MPTDPNPQPPKPVEPNQTQPNQDTSKQKQESKLKDLVIKQGDYQIHVLVECLTQLSTINDSLPDPIVKITCNNETKRTKKVGIKVKEHSFDEHFYFTHQSMTMEKFDSSKILFEVYDRNNTSKKNYIGVQEIDYAAIYAEKEKSIKNTWIALSNINSEYDFSKINGYLRISISILHEDDPRVELSFKDNSDGLVTTAPHITNKYFQLKVSILKGEDFPDMDSLSEKKVGKQCDGFLTMSYMGKTLSTAVVKMKDNVIIWNESIYLPFIFPTTSEKILFRLYDDDLTTKELIGSFEVNIYDVINNKYSSPRYISIYGSCELTSGKYSNMMNENYEIGSNWKGRILLAMSAKETDQPKMGKDPLLLCDHLMKHIQKKNLWVIDWEIIDVLFLPIETGKVCFSVGYEDSIETTPLRSIVNGNILKWNVKRKRTFYHLSNSVQDLSDMFIYFHNGENKGVKSRVCFQRLSCSEIINNEDILIVKLLPDPSIGSIKECKTLLKMKIKLTLETEYKLDHDLELDHNHNENSDHDDEHKPINKQNSQQNTQSPSKKPVQTHDSDSDDLDSKIQIKKPEQKLIPTQNKTGNAAVHKEENEFLTSEPKTGHTVIANVYMSKELIAGDDSGKSDPFIEVTLNGRTQNTSVKYDQINGTWNESLVFDCCDFDIKDISSWPILYLRVLDEDTLSSDPLGYSYIWLSETSYSINSFEKIVPKWHDFRLLVSDRPQGKILLSFFIIEKESANFNKLTNDIPNIDISPECDVYNFDINIVGLRSLEPLGILPIRRPYIHFDLNSIIIPSKNTKKVHPVRSIVTDPIHPGPNPTILTTVNFVINLPKNDIYVPTLTCMVYDKILAGIGNNLLGVFSIDIMRLLKNCQNEYIEDVKIGKNKLGVGLLTGLMGKKLEDNTKINEYEKQLEKVNPNEQTEEDEKELKSLKGENIQSKNIQKEDENDQNDHSEIVNNNVNKGQYAVLKAKEDESDVREVRIVQDKKSKQNLIDKIINNEDKERDVKLRSFQYKLNSNNIVFEPLYKTEKIKFPGVEICKKEDNDFIPDRSLYFEVGYKNPNKENQHEEKHYRRYYHMELENVKELNLQSPFLKIPLRRDKFVDSISSDEIFERLASKNKIIKRFSKVDGKYIIKDCEVKETYRPIEHDKHGYFKGLAFVILDSKKDEYFKLYDNIANVNPLMLKEFKNLTRHKDISKELLIKRDMIVRLYVLELKDLSKRDLTSESDPYLKIFLGDSQVNEKDRYVEDKANVDIYRVYDFPLTLPGAAELRIEAWDYDPLFSDELIGYTSIDLEDRYYDHNWLKLREKPIETRKLYHPDIHGIHGNVSCWVEIFNKEDNPIIKKWKIEQPPEIEYQMRLIVWSTRDIPMMDVEETSDVYIVAFNDPINKQTTDTHYRCTNGEASFNWRILETIKYSPKSKNNSITLQVYDKDLIGSDEYICSANINIKKIISMIYDIDAPFKFTKKYFKDLDLTKEEKEQFEFEDDEKFWVNCKRMNNNVEEKSGAVLCSLEILPIWKASQSIVGKGRDEPNCNPFLPPPEGRIRFSLNPFVLIGQLVGPRIRRKFVMWFICLLCTIFTALALPNIIQYVLSEFVNPYNYVKK